MEGEDSIASEQEEGRRHEVVDGEVGDRPVGSGGQLESHGIVVKQKEAYSFNVYIPDCSIYQSKDQYKLYSRVGLISITEREGRVQLVIADDRREYETHTA